MNQPVVRISYRHCTPTLAHGVTPFETIPLRIYTTHRMSSSLAKSTILVLSIVSAVAESIQPEPDLNYLGLLALLAIPAVIGLAALFFINWGFVCNNPQCGPPIAGTGPCNNECCAGSSPIPCAYDGSYESPHDCCCAPSNGLQKDQLCTVVLCDCAKPGEERQMSNIQMNSSYIVAQV